MTSRLRKNYFSARNQTRKPLIPRSTDGVFGGSEPLFPQPARCSGMGGCDEATRRRKAAQRDTKAASLGEGSGSTP
jgi:hypothetical protein